MNITSRLYCVQLYQPTTINSNNPLSPIRRPNSNKTRRGLHPGNTGLYQNSWCKSKTDHSHTNSIKLIGRSQFFIYYYDRTPNPPVGFVRWALNDFPMTQSGKQNIARAVLKLEPDWRWEPYYKGLVTNFFPSNKSKQKTQWVLLQYHREIWNHKTSWGQKKIKRIYIFRSMIKIQNRSIKKNKSLSSRKKAGKSIVVL